MNKNILLCDEQTAIDYHAMIEKFEQMKLGPFNSKIEHDEDDQKYEIEYKIQEGGEAHVFIEGAMRHRKQPEFLMFFGCGMPSYEGIRELLEALEKSEFVESVVLNIDSGGGVIHGCYDLADYINDYSKPIRTLCDGTLCSAAYLLASATNRIDTSASAKVGSIGAMSQYLDQDSLEHKIIVFRSKGSEHKNELKGKGSNQYQNYINDMGEMFTDRLQKFRGDSNSHNGEIFSGTTALDLKLIDGILEHNRSKEMNNNKTDPMASLEQANANAQANATAAQAQVNANLINDSMQVKLKEFAEQSENKAKAEAVRVATILKAANVSERVFKAISEGMKAEEFALSELQAVRKLAGEKVTATKEAESNARTQTQGNYGDYQKDAEDVNSVAGGADDITADTGKSFSAEEYLNA